MKIATECKIKNDSFSGDARLYHLSAPVTYYDGDTEQKSDYVVVSATMVPYSGPETYIFPADETGAILNWCELNGSFRGGLDHERALTEAGYAIEK